MKKIKILVISAFLAVCTSPLWAMAEGTNFHAQFKNSCGQDLTELCPGAKGRHEIHACLKTNKENLSLSCSNFLAEMKQQWEQRHPAGSP